MLILNENEYKITNYGGKHGMEGGMYKNRQTLHDKIILFIPNIIFL